MNEPTKDLAQLSASAQQEAQQQLKPLPPKKPFLGSRGKGILTGCLAAGALIAAYELAGPYVLGFSDRTLRKDLIASVAAARDHLEATRDKQGKLPESIPDLLHAAAVEYRRSGDGGYRLVATDGTRVVEIDDKGVVKESTVRR